MKRKPLLENMTKRRNEGQVDLPSQTPLKGWHQFYTDMELVINDNFGYHAKKSAEFDKDSGEFHWQEDRVVGRLDGSYVEVGAHFNINVRKNLIEEFKRAEQQYKDWNSACNKIAGMLHAIGGERL